MRAMNLTRVAFATAAVLVAAAVSPQTSRSLVGVSTTIATGSQPDAQAYYRRLSAALRFQNPHTILDSDLDDFLSYCGYRGVAAADFERLDSDVLMDPARLATAVANPDLFAAAFTNRTLTAGEILVARFFAPKITDVSGTADGPVALGWRKLVRLLPRRDSAAAARGITAVWLLFNFFERDLAKSPFNGHSVNTQGLVITNGANRLDPVYWLDYEPLPIARLGLALDATFDARDPNIPSPEHVLGRPDRKYFVPNACAACHGNLNKPLLNYLDTDHWLDRVEAGNDFPAVAESTHGVLFDGGTDVSSAQFRSAFDIVRRLNREMAAQNTSAQPNSPQGRAAAKWLQLHETDMAHIVPLDRPFPGEPHWTKGNALDDELLPLLNRYCYRCHGSVRFNVFDKAAVLSRASDSAVRIEADPVSDKRIDPRVAMPPDRKIRAEDRARLIALFDDILKGK
jgi:hypothetical protein